MKVSDAIKKALPAEAPKPGAFRKHGEEKSAPAETPAEAAAPEATEEGAES